MLTDEQIERFYTQGYCVARVGVVRGNRPAGDRDRVGALSEFFRPDTPRGLEGRVHRFLSDDVDQTSPRPSEVSRMPPGRAMAL